MDEDWIPTAEAAEMLGISRSLLNKWISGGAEPIRYRQAGRKRYVYKPDIVEAKKRMDAIKGLLNSKQAADYLYVKPGTFTTWAGRGTIRAERHFHGYPYYNTEELERVKETPFFKGYEKRAEKYGRKPERRKAGEHKEHSHISSGKGLDPYLKISAAVIRGTLVEYRRALRHPEHYNAERYEEWLRSAWCGTLSMGSFDPEIVIEKMRKETGYEG